MANMAFVKDDGGRAAAGFKGKAGDCVARSVAIASGRPYREIYEALASGTGSQRKSSRTPKRSASARSGINTRRKWFKDFMCSIGFEWTPTMLIGQGCKVHLAEGELPAGKLVVSLSGHYTAVIDGVVHDTWDPQRETYCTEPYREPMPEGCWSHDGVTMHHVERRCVYGFWSFNQTQEATM